MTSTAMVHHVQAILPIEDDVPLTVIDIGHSQRK
jgi:hypothetical protein